MNIKAFVGGLLMVLGGLVATLTGGCGLIFTIFIAADSFSRGIEDAFMFLAMLFVVSGIPFAIGCFVAYCGWIILPGNKSKHDDVL